MRKKKTERLLECRDTRSSKNRNKESESKEENKIIEGEEKRYDNRTMRFIAYW